MAQWRIDPRWLSDAQDDAVRLAVADQVRAGLDIVTDGEIRRESYSNHFANALEGIDRDHPGSVHSRAGTPAPVPRITGPIARREPVHLADLSFLRAHTDRLVKVTVPGPFTMSQQARNEYYAAEEELHICFGYPAFVPDHPPAYHFLAELAAVPLAQISIETAQSGLDLAVLDRLSGKTIMLGVIALDSPAVESAEEVAGRIRRALPYKRPAELVAAPDCGMKYLPRDAAFAKLEALVAGARAVREDPAVAGVSAR